MPYNWFCGHGDDSTGLHRLLDLRIFGGNFDQKWFLPFEDSSRNCSQSKEPGWEQVRRNNRPGVESKVGGVEDRAVWVEKNRTASRH